MELVALREAGTGVLYNDFSPTGRSPEMNVLHRATCRSLSRMNLGVTKWVADDEAAAVSWLVAERGVEDVVWHRCPTCFGSEPAVSMAAPQRAGGPTTGADVGWHVSVDEGVSRLEGPRPISYPPRPPWMDDCSAALRQELRELRLAPGSVLEAELHGSLPPGADLENVLLYNVPVPSSLLRNGVRLAVREVAPGRGVVQRYRVVEPAEGRRRCGRCRPRGRRSLATGSAISEPCLAPPARTLGDGVGVRSAFIERVRARGDARDAALRGDPRQRRSRETAARRRVCGIPRLSRAWTSPSASRGSLGPSAEPIARSSAS